ncbi:hypothetical protein SCALM49S_05503 [Streptomyces californicus]
MRTRRAPWAVRRRRAARARGTSCGHLAAGAVEVLPAVPLADHGLQVPARPPGRSRGPGRPRRGCRHADAVGAQHAVAEVGGERQAVGDDRDRLGGGERAEGDLSLVRPSVVIPSRSSRTTVTTRRISPAPPGRPGGRATGLSGRRAGTRSTSSCAVAGSGSTTVLNRRRSALDSSLTPRSRSLAVAMRLNPRTASPPGPAREPGGSSRTGCVMSASCTSAGIGVSFLDPGRHASGPWPASADWAPGRHGWGRGPRQAPGLAARVRELGAITGSGPGGPVRLLEELRSAPPAGHGAARPGAAAGAAGRDGTDQSWACRVPPRTPVRDHWSGAGAVRHPAREDRRAADLAVRAGFAPHRACCSRSARPAGPRRRRCRWARRSTPS